jgi:ribosomal protein S18 acetylase RimI-like enzyme
MHIRRLVPSDAAAFQRLRLYSLQESPTAFGSSYEEEVGRPLEAISESLALRYLFGAFENEVLVGIVGVGRESGLKQNHFGFVRSMYVEPSSRKNGIGTALIRHAMQVLGEMPGLRQVTLSVTADNDAAISTYEKFGFKVYGKVPEALHFEGNYFDEIQMICRVGEQ